MSKLGDWRMNKWMIEKMNKLMKKFSQTNVLLIKRKEKTITHCISSDIKTTKRRRKKINQTSIFIYHFQFAVPLYESFLFVLL